MFRFIDKITRNTKKNDLPIKSSNKDSIQQPNKHTPPQMGIKDSAPAPTGVADSNEIKSVSLAGKNNLENNTVDPDEAFGDFQTHDSNLENFAVWDSSFAQGSFALLSEKEELPVIDENQSASLEAQVKTENQTISANGLDNEKLEDITSEDNIKNNTVIYNYELLDMTSKGSETVEIFDEKIQVEIVQNIIQEVVESVAAIKNVNEMTNVIVNDEAKQVESEDENELASDIELDLDVDVVLSTSQELANENISEDEISEDEISDKGEELSGKITKILDSKSFLNTNLANLSSLHNHFLGFGNVTKDVNNNVLKRLFNAWLEKTCTKRDGFSMTQMCFKTQEDVTLFERTLKELKYARERTTKNYNFEQTSEDFIVRYQHELHQAIDHNDAIQEFLNNNGAWQRRGARGHNQLHFDTLETAEAFIEVLKQQKFKWLPLSNENLEYTQQGKAEFVVRMEPGEYERFKDDLDGASRLDHKPIEQPERIIFGIG